MIWLGHTKSFSPKNHYFYTTTPPNDNWSENVPPEIMSSVKGYAILQQREPRWRIFDKGGQFLRWLVSPEGKETISAVIAIAVLL